MVSPGTLRALCALRDGPAEAFEPTITDTGDVRYDAIEDHLGPREGDPVAVLDSLTDRGLLAAAFECKVYVCPHCAAEGMQYSTGCPDCGSVRTIREEQPVHADCETPLDHVLRDTTRHSESEEAAPTEQDSADQQEGEVDATAAEQTDQSERGTDETAAEPTDATASDATGTDPDGGQAPVGATADHWCPTCEADVPPADRDVTTTYRCDRCATTVDTPAHRLWCRDCLETVAPAEAREQALYTYSLTPTGERWIEAQLEGRDSLAETFRSRGYETTVDATVTADDGEIPVHVHATDDLLDDRLVAGVHETPSRADVSRLLEAAAAAGARPVVLVTGDSIDGAVAGLLESENVTVLRSTDGHLTRAYDVATPPERENRLFAWIDDLLSSSAP